jgi:UDP-3-O-[3-hydroxymyristoyl] glucosamine N-acyltransferase
VSSVGGAGSPPDQGGLRAADIATLVGGTLEGEPDARVTGFAPLPLATATDASFFSHARYADDVATTQAAVVLVTAALAPAAAHVRARVIVADPHAALIDVLPRLYPSPPRPLGVHASAVIGDGVSMGAGVTVEPFARIGDGVALGDGVWIGPHCDVAPGVRIGAHSRLVSHNTLYPRTVLGERVVLHAGTRIGSDGFGYSFGGGMHRKIPHVGGCVIDHDVEIGANCTIDRGSIGDTVVGAGTKIDNLCHVAHNVRIGRLCLLMAGVGISGSTTLGDGVIMAGQSGSVGHVTIGAGARIAGRGGVASDVPPGETWSGFPARPHTEVLRGQATVRRLTAIVRDLERLLKGNG